MKQAGPKRRLPRKRVLVVEDDTATGEMLVAVLGMEDYTVTWVSTPGEAMARPCGCSLRLTRIRI
jgi:CheY-like chemotaxis protein